jgi:hypothetical protein
MREMMKMCGKKRNVPILFERLKGQELRVRAMPEKFLRNAAAGTLPLVSHFRVPLQ